MVGDDAAILPGGQGPDRDWVVTTDILIDGVHFSDRTTPPESVGWRAAAANLSDLAAMGAAPEAITVALGLPGDTVLDWPIAVYSGMQACLARFGGAIVGGDIARSPVKTLSITALGRVASGRALVRTAAQPGDAIAVTGIHGASRAGLAALLEPAAFGDLPRDRVTPWIRAHQYPIPRFDAVAHLPEGDRDRPWAAMDSSDGLADALLQLSRESGVGLRLDRAALPIPPGLAAAVGDAVALDWTLYGGEDFELVLALPPAIAADLVQCLGNGAAIVGTVTRDRAIVLTDGTGRHPDQFLNDASTFQHFAPVPNPSPATP